MNTQQLGTYWFLLRSFRNGLALVQNLRKGGLLPNGPTVDEAVFWDGTRLMHPPGRGGFIGILLEMFRDNVYEIGEFYTPRPKDVVVDIGAHVGLFSYVLLRDHPCRVVAFEPFKENFACLEHNLKRFDGTRVGIFNIAVGAERGKVQLEIPESTNRTHDAILTVAEGDEPGLIDMIPLDEVFAVAGTDRIALLKMDIEGSEYDAFKEASPSCLRGFEKIAMEYHDNLREGTLELLKSRLEETHALTVIPHGPGITHGTLFASLKEHLVHQPV